MTLSKRLICMCVLIACLVVGALIGSVLWCASADADSVSDDAEQSTAEASEAAAIQNQLVDSYLAGTEEAQGLAILVSTDGEITTEGYYGYADDADSVAVDADTVFEWGRTSDLIVWIAVMQLMEDGLLDLGDYVEPLLPDGITLPEGYASITILDLMNHTTGLDVSMVGAHSSIADGTTSVVPAFNLFSVRGEFDPGAAVAYSPYDALLAAAVVEGVTETDFVDYVQEEIFDRLGMNDTYLMVGGSASRMARQSDAPDPVKALADGTTSYSGRTTTSSSVFTCCGTVSDLLTLANAAMCIEGCPAAFDDPATADELFTVSRIYTGIDAARFAHGLFAYPFSSGVFGLSASVSTGYSASVYMDPENGFAIAILVNQENRADLVQGIPRLFFERTDGAVTSGSTAENMLWVGMYQDASLPDHGPAKLLTALQRVRVSINDQGVLRFNGVTATSLGSGIYSLDTADDQDVYRFHIDLERGSEYSRVESDSYLVPWSTQVIETILLIGLAIALLLCAVRVIMAIVMFIRGRIRHRHHVAGQGQQGVVALAFATCVAGGLGIYATVRLAGGMLVTTLNVVLIFEAIYIIFAVITALWFIISRIRAPHAWTYRQNRAALIIALSALVTVLNLVYWEMLP